MAKFYSITLVLLGLLWVTLSAAFEIKYIVTAEQARSLALQTKNDTGENIQISQNVFKCTFTGMCTHFRTVR